MKSCLSGIIISCMKPFLIKGSCATLVLWGRAVLSDLVNNPYMNCKHHENLGKAMAANSYGSPVQ